MKRRSVVALAVGSLALLAIPAHGAGHTFSGTATATSFELTIQGEGLIFGFTEAAAQSGPTADGCEGDKRACATGMGVITPGFEAGAEAEAPGNPGPNSAVGGELPGEFGPLLSATFGRGTAQASANGDAIATGDAAAGELALTATQTLAGNIPIQDALDELSTQLLGPIAEGAEDTPFEDLANRLKATVDYLSANLAEAPILVASIGPSRSDVRDVDGVVTATATAGGVRLIVAPTPETVDNLLESPEGLVVVEVGSAIATATSDQVTASSSYDPAIVRVKFLNPSTGEFDEVPVEGGGDCTPFEGTPLEPLTVCVGVGSGDHTVNGAAAAARANGVSIELFRDPLPTVVLALAVAEAGVNAAPPPPAPPAPAPPVEEAPPALPRTGGALALPALALLGLGMGLQSRMREGR